MATKERTSEMAEQRALTQYGLAEKEVPQYFPAAASTSRIKATHAHSTKSSTHRQVKMR